MSDGELGSGLGLRPRAGQVVRRGDRAQDEGPPRAHRLQGHQVLLQVVHLETRARRHATLRRQRRARGARRWCGSGERGSGWCGAGGCASGERGANGCGQGRCGSSDKASPRQYRGRGSGCDRGSGRPTAASAAAHQSVGSARAGGKRGGDRAAARCRRCGRGRWSSRGFSNFLARRYEPAAQAAQFAIG